MVVNYHELTCQVCGKDFKNLKPNVKTCSKVCEWNYIHLNVRPLKARQTKGAT